MLVECGGLFGHSPRGREDHGSEGCMLHLTNALLIGSFLCFHACGSMTGAGCCGGLSMRIENTNIEECTLIPSSPKAACDDIQASALLSVQSSSGKDLSRFSVIYL